MTTCAINEGYTVAQTYLGTKVHDAKDPDTDLGPMLRQVVSTVFYLMGAYERNWGRDNPIQFAPVNNKREEEPGLAEVPVSIKNLTEEFLQGFNHFSPMYHHILASENLDRLEQIHKNVVSGLTREVRSFVVRPITLLRVRRLGLVHACIDRTNRWTSRTAD